MVLHECSDENRSAKGLIYPLCTKYRTFSTQKGKKTVVYSRGGPFPTDYADSGEDQHSFQRKEAGQGVGFNFQT